MATIHLLDQNTINQIAAGEVVERPASVIKELVENAIDAGSSAVTVEVKDGGLKLIRITDNGSGIEKAQVRTAFLRHATSKIYQAADLLTIASLGFRGEALASIAAVSMVELMTKTVEDITGVRYVIEGGIESKYEEIGCPVGTTILVKDLFFNTPARLKFMKSPSTELAYVTDLMSKLAMGHPEVSFKFISNGTVKLHTVGNGVLQDCIYHVYGKDVARNLIPIETGTEEVTVSGYIGKPHISRGNRTYENYYINGRYIKSKLIERSIEDGFKTKLMQHRYPFVCLHFTMSAKEVDVNVHPTKMEVRFSNEEALYKAIFNVVYEGLHEKEMIPDVTLDTEVSKKIVYDKTLPEPFELSRVQSVTAQSPQTLTGERGTTNDFVHDYRATYDKINLLDKHTYSGPPKKQDVLRSETKYINEPDSQEINKPDNGVHNDKNPQVLKNQSQSGQKNITDSNGIPSYINGAADRLPKPYSGEQAALSQPEFLDKESMKTHTVIGQLFDTYWIVALEDKYYIIDQHAAHEKVLYERLINQLKAHKILSQGLLRPLVVQVSPAEMVRYLAHKDLFADIGFEVETFGERDLMIRSVPFIFNETLDANQFIQILDELEDQFHTDKLEHIKHDLATMACKAAVKGNDRLTLIEYQHLIEDLLTLEDPFNCPHGRPTIIAMTKYELEKKFKRIQ